MIVRIVKMTLYPDKLGEFLKEFDLVKKQIRSFKGCNATELMTDVAKSGVVFTYSLWDSTEDLEAYRNSELFKTTWSRVKPYFREKAEAWSLLKQDD
jgi:(4S)-4-hydroxy-5-phosphonooxypentane-2,3-dione isomerase